MEEHRLPSFNEISELKHQHPEVLKDRTHPQIKSWIDNKNKATTRKLSNSIKRKEKVANYSKKR